MSGDGFPYSRAFSRNLGWVTAEEQQTLRGTRIAIAGLGGVGGIYLLTLARLGIGSFSIADFDSFAYENFNRQAGATVGSIGHRKIDVMLAMARDINPDLDVRLFSQGLTASNCDEFLEGCSVYLDGLDFFAFDIRQRVFSTCRTNGIPAVTVAPLGMGAALLNFLPGSMSFEDYFRFGNSAPSEKAMRFLIGLSPAMLQLPYLVDSTYVNLSDGRGPSTVIAVQLCSGIAAVQVLKIVLRRGEVLAAPHGLHFDAYRNRLKRTWRPWGNANPLQRLLLGIAKRRLARPS